MDEHDFGESAKVIYKKKRTWPTGTRVCVVVVRRRGLAQRIKQPKTFPENAFGVPKPSVTPFSILGVGKKQGRGKMTRIRVL